jgi:hypothetical protein
MLVSGMTRTGCVKICKTAQRLGCSQPYPPTGFGCAGTGLAIEAVTPITSRESGREEQEKACGPTAST